MKSKFNEWVHSSSVLIEMITLISHGVPLLDAPPPKLTDCVLITGCRQQLDSPTAEGRL